MCITIKVSKLLAQWLYPVWFTFIAWDSFFILVTIPYKYQANDFKNKLYYLGHSSPWYLESCTGHISSLRLWSFKSSCHYSLYQMFLSNLRMCNNKIEKSYEELRVYAFLSTTSHFPSTVHSDSNHVYTPMWPSVKFTFFCSRLYSAISATIQTIVQWTWRGLNAWEQNAGFAMPPTGDIRRGVLHSKVRLRIIYKNCFVFWSLGRHDKFSRISTALTLS